MGIRNILFKVIGGIQYIPIYFFLNYKGYRHVRLFSFKTWHHGVSYYTAYTPISKKKVFIKTSGTYNAAKTEYECLTAINSYMKNIVPMAYKLYDWKLFSFVVIEYIEGNSLIQTEIQESAFENFSKLIIDALNHTKIIHRDITEDNIIVKQNKGLFLIDFAWGVHSSTKKTKQHINELKALGGIGKPGLLIWQDSYSLGYIYNKRYNKAVKLPQTLIYEIEAP